jgi:hypothetical protein
MHDDGLHGDGAAGDSVWGAVLSVKPAPGQMFYWATDDNDLGPDGWLGSCPSFVVEDASAQTITMRALPEEAHLTPAEFIAKYGVDLSKPAPPARLGDSSRLLFTFHAPEAQRVFLATSTNDWGRNHQGQVRDGRALMYKHPDSGVWYRSADAPDGTLAYKFVSEGFTGSHFWQADPLNARKDGDGNSLALLDQAPVIASPGAPTEGTEIDRAPVSWVPYSDAALAEIVAGNGRALVYIRADNERCEALEQRFLFTSKGLKYLSGSRVLILDAAEPGAASVIERMGVFRVPSLAWTAGDGKWRLINQGDSAREETVAEFLAQYTRTR